MSKIEKDDVWRTALHKGLQGGTSGAMAMTIQVSSLMWMRTTMNYQYRYGTTTTQAMRHLWKEGGVLLLLFTFSHIISCLFTILYIIYH